MRGFARWMVFPAFLITAIGATALALGSGAPIPVAVFAIYLAMMPGAAWLERTQADSNYGNSFIFWDTVFGTRYLPRGRETPARVGIAGLEAFPTGPLAQRIAPLGWHATERDSAARAASRPDPRYSLSR